MIVWLYVSVHSQLFWVTNDSLLQAQVNGFGSVLWWESSPKTTIRFHFEYLFVSMKTESMQHGICSLAAWIKTKRFLSCVGKREEVNRPFPDRIPWSLDFNNVVNFVNPTPRCLLIMCPCCCWTPNTGSWISWNYGWNPAPPVHTCEMYTTRVAFRSELLASRVPLFFSLGWPQCSCLARAVAGCRN